MDWWVVDVKIVPDLSWEFKKKTSRKIWNTKNSFEIKESFIWGRTEDVGGEAKEGGRGDSEWVGREHILASAIVLYVTDE